MRRAGQVTLVAALAFTSAGTPRAQSFNFDFGPPDSGPAATYAAAGTAGYWNSIPAAHGTSTPGLRDLAGNVTGVSISQVGGFSLLTQNDPLVTGDDAVLLDDFLVTYSPTLETCIYLDGLQPGTYEVLIYARMPDPQVSSHASVDQEPGFPHYSVGGAWSGAHALLVSYSRHVAIVGPGGDLDLHSGVVPGAQAALGAALNGLQVYKLDLYANGFE